MCLKRSAFAIRNVALYFYDSLCGCRRQTFCLIYLFVCLFLAVLGLHCCAQVFSSCGERGLLFVVVHGLLIAVASLVAEHGL